MIPTFTTLLKTLAGKTILGVAVVSMGVGAAAAGPNVFTQSDTQDHVEEQVVEQRAEDADDQGSEDADDQGSEAESSEAESAAAESFEEESFEEESSEAAGSEEEGSAVEDVEDGGSKELEGSEDEDLEATCPPAEVSEDEVLEWKVVKTQCRDAWHELRDEKQAEWLDAKARFNELCGDDDDDSVEPDGSVEGDAETECKLLKAELKQLHEDGKSEWKTARDEAKVVWKALKDEAKADAKSERDDAKADAKAERSDAKAERSDAKAERSDAKAERKAAKRGK